MNVRDKQSSDSVLTSVTTDLVELRPLRESDKSEFIRIQRESAEHFAPWVARRALHQTVEKFFEDQLRKSESGLRGGPDMRLGAWLPGGRLAGLFSLGQIFRGPFLNGYAGSQVAIDCFGRGIATSAVIGLLDLAFLPEPKGLGLHRVQANVIPRNGASVRYVPTRRF